MKPNTKQIDPTVVIPAAVRRQTERVNAALQQHVDNLNGVTDGGNGDPEPNPALPDPAPQPDPTPQPDPAPQQPQAKKDGEPDYKALYLTLKGRHEVLVSDNKNMRARMDNMERIMATVAAAPPAPAPAPAEEISLITDNDREQYGDELIDLARRAAREEAARMAKSQEMRFSQVEGRVKGFEQISEKDARTRMMEWLDANQSDWRKINEDPEFYGDGEGDKPYGWLEQNDPLTGMQRRGMLTQAWNLNDAPRVAAFFKEFLREQGGQGPTPKPEVTPAVKTPAVSLGAFAAPGKTRQSAPVKPGDDTPVSRRDIAEFYTNVSAGKYASDPALKAQIEATIFAAQAAGRIVP